MKFKRYEVDGFYLKINDDGTESPAFSNRGEIGKQLFSEMQDWVFQGNEIEAAFVGNELAEKEAKDLQMQLEGQRHLCRLLLKDCDHTQFKDFQYPEDAGQWDTYRAELKRIIKSDTVETVQEKPFS